MSTTQYLSPALHKSFTDADFDFKVCDCDEHQPAHIAHCVIFKNTHISFSKVHIHMYTNVLDVGLYGVLLLDTLGSL